MNKKLITNFTSKTQTIIIHAVQRSAVIYRDVNCESSQEQQCESCARCIYVYLENIMYLCLTVSK